MRFNAFSPFAAGLLQQPWAAGGEGRTLAGAGPGRYYGGASPLTGLLGGQPGREALAVQALQRIDVAAAAAGLTVAHRAAPRVP
jgi:hypothetical protein